MRETILVTGAGGYVGARLVERIRATTDADVIPWVHGAAPDGGDLASDDAFAHVDAARVTRIIHAAAVTRFNVEAEVADRVNVGGARRVFDFASRCPRLRHLTYVSTVYAAGLRTGAVREDALDRAPRFANHYERSKWEAETMLLTEYTSLPSTIARVATVIADDDGGAVTQRNAVHNTLKLLFHGLLSLVPGEADTPVYFVTGSLVVEALAALAVIAPDKAPKFVHVSHGRAESATLGELVDLAFEIFAKDPGFQKRRLLKPLLVDAESFEMLVSGIDGFGGDAVRQALASVAPFARQLFSAKEIANDQLKAIVPAYTAPIPQQLVTNTVAHLVATRWGRA
ncbi:MAG TPA: SDR family oxidoreductase [Kofleriaceae bacterium]|nr:SDR family oxidoreductase [Kofleriaceae bacterium]